MDADLGPFCLKFCAYFRYNAKLCQRQPLGAATSSQGRARVTPLDNASADGRGPGRVAADIDALLRKRLAILPHPLQLPTGPPATFYDISILQAEFSVTQMLEAPVTGPDDFQIGKRLVSLPALREIGFSANRRLLRARRLDHDPIIGTVALHMITDPVTTEHGTRVSGLPLGQQNAMPCSPR